jgi:seryl-tRNA synthetase
MLDINFIRENRELVKEAAAKKNVTVDIDRLLKLDNDRRDLIASVEKERARQNEVSDQIARSTPDDRQTLIEGMRTLKEELQKEEEKLKKVMQRWQEEMLKVPNVPDMTVPVGKSDADNQEIKRWGQEARFGFTPKSHVDLMTELDMVDFERGVKVAGFRGYFLKNDAVRLVWALWQLAFDMLVERGFTPMMAPSLVKREPFMGTGYLPQSEEDLYKTQDDLYLSGTAEVPTMGYFMNETLTAADLPRQILSFSPCFRREAGSHGKDTKGLMRVHEFFKLEQIVLCEANHQASVEWHEKLLANAEALMQRLNLPYRVVLNCAGDLGLGQVKKYDIEAWVPSEGKYRETHSASYFHDFQTRRLNIRYRDEAGKIRYAHSLNNTAVATPRILIPLVENNQQADGSIIVPEALQPYVGKAVITRVPQKVQPLEVELAHQEQHEGPSPYTRSDQQ